MEGGLRRPLSILEGAPGSTVELRPPRSVLFGRTCFRFEALPHDAIDVDDQTFCERCYRPTSSETRAPWNRLSPCPRSEASFTAVTLPTGSFDSVTGNEQHSPHTEPFTTPTNGKFFTQFQKPYSEILTGALNASIVWLSKTIIARSSPEQ
jgi:hypothetical protein